MTQSRKIRQGLIAIVAVAIAFIASACLAPEQQSVLDAMNRSRTSDGIHPLPVNPEAQAKAQQWANKLAQDNRLSHSTLSAGFSNAPCAVSENVGHGISVEQVHGAYLNSRPHRANVMSDIWTSAGVGYATNNVDGYRKVFTVIVFVKDC